MKQVINQKWANGYDNKNAPTVEVLDNSHILIISDADTDSDGSPDAEIIDPKFGTLQTSLSHENGWKGKGKFVNARIIPYFVLPSNWFMVTGIKISLGDIARLSYKNSSIYAIYADTGPKEIIGEASISAVESLGVNPWGKNGKIVSGINYGVSYEIIKNSANLEITVSFETIQSYGKELFGEKIGLISTSESLKLDNILSNQKNGKAETFVSFFSSNYGDVRDEVLRWFAPINNGSPTHNGCVAHLVSCLKLCNFPYPDLDSPAAINVDNFSEWAVANNWSRIDDRSNMEPGDICISGPKSEPHEFDHAYCFVAFADSGYAYVLHNQNVGIAKRSLDGVGCGVWRYALRMP